MSSNYTSASLCGPPNTLMCVEVALLTITPLHHGYLRCAGPMGFHVFEELVALHNIIPRYYEVETHEYQHPLLPEATYGVPINGNVDGVQGGCVVVSLAALHHHSMPLPLWREMTCSSLRIHNGRALPHHHLSTIRTTQLPPRIGMATRANYIELTGFETTDILPSYFLSDCGDIASLDLSPLANIKVIQEYFLGCCSHLVELDLSPLKAVTIIGDGFLHGCAALLHLDFTGCDSIEGVGVGFLASCTSLKSVNLSPLHRITTIEASFLKGCSSLTSINLTPFTNVTKIGFKFLSGCKSLTSIDLSPFSQGVLAYIDHLFLDRCVGITSLDVSPLLSSNIITREHIMRAMGTDLTENINLKWK